MLASEHVSEPTRRVLLSRLDARYDRQFFNENEFARLQAAAVRLLPHDPAEMELAGLVDRRLHSGQGDGWRYADAPPDGEAYRALAHRLCRKASRREAARRRTRALEARFKTSHPHAFEDLLSELTEGFMAHPLTQYRFGYAGFADVPGWPQVGPDELQPREQQYGPR